MIGGAIHQAARRGPGGDAAFGVVNAVVLAAVGSHLLAWPRRRTFAGLPWLVDCEGRGSELMRWYNPLLYGPGVLAAIALALENRTAPRLRALGVGTAAVPLLVNLQGRDFASRCRRAVSIEIAAPAPPTRTAGLTTSQLHTDATEHHG